MAKVAHIDFMEDVTHFAAFGFMVQKNILELEDARKKIAELEAKIEELKSEKKCDCECECECDKEDPPTLKDLKELARFLVDTNDEIMGIDIEVTLRKNEEETDADSDDSE